MRPLVADFYEVPRARLGELREAATPRWRLMGKNKDRWSSMLASLGRPVPRYESDGYYLAAVIGYLSDLGIETEPAAYTDLLMDLVEFQGGGWDLLEPNADTIARLDPDSFDEAELRAFYAGESEAEADHPNAGEAMLRDIRLLREALLTVDRDSVLLIHM